MKVQVTFELDDIERLSIGVKETGHFVPASRAEARSFITEHVNREIAAIVTTVQTQMAEIKHQLGIEENIIDPLRETVANQ